jgi:hypothetical protein
MSFFLLTTKVLSASPLYLLVCMPLLFHYVTSSDDDSDIAIISVLPVWFDKPFRVIVDLAVYFANSLAQRKTVMRGSQSLDACSYHGLFSGDLVMAIWRKGCCQHLGVFGFCFMCWQSPIDQSSWPASQTLPNILNWYVPDCGAQFEAHFRCTL